MTGDAQLAEEPAQTRIETRSEAPKPTNKPTNKPIHETIQVAAESETASGGDMQSSVIELAGRMAQVEVAETPAVMRSGGDLVTVRAKPEKRKNYKERAKAKFAKDDDAKEAAKDGTTPDMTATAKSEAKVKAKAEAKAKAKAERQKVKAERQKAKKGGKKGKLSKSAA